jgi:hypothetical protein
MAYDLDKSDEAAAAVSSPPISRRIQPRRAASPRGAEELKQIAAVFEKAGDTDALLDVLGAVAESDPSDLEVRAGWRWPMSRAAISTRRARIFPQKRQGTNPALWLTLAEMELRADRLAEGKAAIVQALSLDRNQTQAVVVLGCKLAEANPEAGISRSTRSPTPPSRRAISPLPPSRFTSSPRACARTSSR